MTSHVRFPALDAAKTPATFSRKITGKLLRDRLGFKGVVVSDDLCMGAVTEHLPIQQAAIQALDAGHDILLIAHEPRTQREACELLEHARESGLISPARIAASSQRIHKLMTGHHDGEGSGSMPAEGSALAYHIAQQAVRLVQAGNIPLPLPLTTTPARNIAVLWPDFREVRDRFTLEGGPQGPVARLRRRLSRWPARASITLTSIMDAGPKTTAAFQRAQEADIVLLFCFEAMRFKGQAEILKKLQSEIPEKLVVCLIRNPRDASLLRAGVTALDSAGYRDCSIDALLDALHP